jgi:hypothetical protein
MTTVRRLVKNQLNLPGSSLKDRPETIRQRDEVEAPVVHQPFREIRRSSLPTEDQIRLKAAFGGVGGLMTAAYDNHLKHKREQARIEE